MKNKVVAVVLSIVLVLLLSVFGAGWFMLDYALKPASDNRDMSKRYRMMYAEYPYMRQWVDSMRQADALRDTFVVMPDGERHHAVYARGDSSAGRTAILVHGYKDSHVGMMPLARMYAGMGFNVLLPDLHAHGLSEGADIRMGWGDARHVRHWISVAGSMFADTLSRLRIVIHGVSMGAATVMNVAGDSLPPAVRCVIEDCGYTSVWDEFAHQLADQFGLPPFPVLYAASALCRLRYGWSFGEASSVDCIRAKDVPMLFIHGSSDTYVPSDMVLQLFNANPVSRSPDGRSLWFNDIWLTPGCAHADSFHDYPSHYSHRVAAFLSRYGF